MSFIQVVLTAFGGPERLELRTVGALPERGDVAAVYLEGRTLPRKVRALIDFAVEDFGNAGAYQLL